jgi:hypothetical protein
MCHQPLHFSEIPMLTFVFYLMLGRVPIVAVGEGDPSFSAPILGFTLVLGTQLGETSIGW